MKRRKNDFCKLLLCDIIFAKGGMDLFSINNIIIYIMLGFMVFATVDKLFLKNKFGYGEQLDEAFNAMGPLALAIVGIMCFAPVIGKFLTPLFTPLYNFFGADPAMAAGSLLASDMGGFALAGQMTSNTQIQGLSGILLGSMMGVTIIFIIPYTSTVIEKSDRAFLSKGIMAGIIPIPIGCLIGGLIAGIPVMILLKNLILVAVFAIVLALLLVFAPNFTVKLFSVFSKIITILIGLMLAVAIIDALTGYTLGGLLFGSETIVPGMAHIEDQFIVVGLIASMLAGAYPFIRFLTTILTKPLVALGKVIGVNSVTVAGMLACLANSIPMYTMVKDMDNRGKVMSIAFSVCAGFCLGDFLGFTSANAPEFIFPMIAGKLCAGVIALFIAHFVAEKKPKEKKIAA